MMEDQSLSAEKITRALRTRNIGQRVLYYPQLPSTMDVAREEAQHGAPQGTVIIADEQTAGRGRLKRDWLSPPGSISVSIIVHPDLAYLPYLTMLAALAVYHAIAWVTGLQPALKWPNDVLANGKKVCGILLESNIFEGKVSYAIIGIGLNVNVEISSFSEIPDTATSLSAEMGREMSRIDIIMSLLEHFERLYLKLPDGDDIFQEWQRRLTTLGQKVKVTSGGSTLTGIAESVARDGSLLLRQADGSTTRIVAGDVTLRGFSG
ncbi:biotin--[acetyl-CoA-carboxylase] ligase [Chloroflexota bacterium]